jgi:hypothetical protein
VVAVGAAKTPRLLDRRRIELVSGGFHVSRFVYHAAQELPLAEADRKVREVRTEAEGRAREAIALQVSMLRSQGHEPDRCSIVGAKQAVPSDLATILRSHALVHAAEGGLYRAALAAGAKSTGLEVVARSPKELDLSASLLRELGNGAGAPWGRDQKLAALAAALCL